jgi:hypothetical protein
MDTMLLDENWDITLDATGNMALASSVDRLDPEYSEAYGQAQDACSQIRLFRGELFYDTLQGVPYWESILGYLPSTQLMISKFEQAALLVPGIVQATCSIISVQNRTVQGQVEITNTAGVSATSTFSF